MNHTSLLAAAVLLGGLTAHHLQGETLASYNFSTNLAPTFSAPGLTAGTVALGSFSGVSASGNYGRSGANGGNLFSRAEDAAAGTPNYILPTTAALALSNNTYFEFTFTPAAGEVFNFTSFAVDIGSQTISTGVNDVTVKSAYTGHFFLRSSLDGYASNLGTDSYFTEAEVSGAHGPNQTFTSNLGLAFTSVASAVTFRIYLYIETDSRHSSQSLRLDNVTLSGSSAIPEPAHAGVLFGAATILAVCGTRRRIRR